MVIGIIGQGFVGGSLTTVLSERGEVVFVYDKAGKKAPGGNDSFFEPTGTSRIFFYF